MALTPEQQRELNELTAEQIRLKKEAGELNAEELAYLEELIGKRKINIKGLQDEIAALEAYQAKLQGIGNTIDGNLLKRQVARDLLEKELALLQEQIKSQELISDQDLEQIAALEKQLETQDKILDVQSEMNKNMRQQTSLVQQAEKAGMKLGLALQNPSLILGEMNVGFQKLGGLLTGKFMDGMVGMIMSFDKTSKAFETQFAVGQQYEDQLGSIYGEQAQMGVSMEELTKGMGDLIGSFTDFTMLAPAQREELAKTATVMQEAYGIATQDFAQGIQFSTKMMGMGVMEAKQFQGEIVATAQALGVAPQQLSAQFAQMGPQLAKFGTEGGKTFKELARLSKITGMEMGKILAVTNKFDTFEGAAEQAGQLNAALGGNFVNAMDLMMATDPAERFGMIRDAILDTGLSFDTMSYYQKQFYTNALGLSDVGDLALMLSGNTELMANAGNQSAASYEEQAKRAKELMDIQETLKSIFLANADAVQTLANGLAFVARLLADNYELIGALTVAYMGVNAIMAVRAAGRAKEAVAAQIEMANTLKEIALTQKQIATDKMHNKVLLEKEVIKKSSAGPVKGGMASAFGTAATIAAIGVALLGFGAAVKFAGEGIAVMAEAMKDLSPEQMAALNDIMITLGLTMGGLAITLGIFAAVAGASAGPLLAFGGAVALIGAGIGIAAAGIGYMAEGFANMFNALDASGVDAIVGLFASIGLGAPMLVLAGIGMGALAVGMGLFGLSLKLIATDDLKAIATFTESLAKIETSQMRELADTIKAVANAMDDIPVKKATVFETVIKQTALSATAVAEANRQTPAVATAGAGRAGTAATAGGRGKIGEVLIKFDSELFEQKVISIYEEADGIKAREDLLE
ncbi:MAG: hypothetical protein VW270_02735 [Candidatus Poseidoniales archaeon]